MIRISLLIFLSILFFSFRGYSQMDDNPAYESLNHLFNEKVDGDAYIFTGPEYVFPAYKKKGFPYFLSDSMMRGWIRYDGHIYRNISLHWDILQNYVLTKSVNGAAKIILRNELIDSFNIGEHTIVKLTEDKSINLYNSGFYDALYRGATQVYAMRQKGIYHQIEGYDVVYHYTDKDRYYVKKNGIFYRVSNKKEVLNLFAGHRAAINRAVRKAGMKWRPNFESALVVAAIHYDSSNH